MGNTTHIDPPFGQFALPAGREAIRMSAGRMRGNQIGRWTISLQRKRAIKGLMEPFDIDVDQRVKARLYPSTNRCEKRALCGVQIWDPIERGELQDAIEAPSDETFIFLDIGANVGLYSLYANAYARKASRTIRLIAVEPSSEMGARLSVNAAASGAQIELIRTAISTKAGHVFLSDGNGNRGEGQLSDRGEPVTAMPLLQLCEQVDIKRIDALKLDIEGADLAVLMQFFEQAPTSLHPQMMILELDETSSAPLIELTQAHNYLITKRTRMNVVVRKRDQT